MDDPVGHTVEYVLPGL